MVTRRTAKSKGNQFEYDAQYSLKKVFKDAYLTKERGFQRQYDIRSDNHCVIVECKRLKSMSWNKAEKFYNKLLKMSPDGYKCYLLFKSNRQPCLTMFINDDKCLTVKKFEDVFKVSFEKHPSTRQKKGEKNV